MHRLLDHPQRGCIVTVLCAENGLVDHPPNADLSWRRLCNLTNVCIHPTSRAPCSPPPSPCFPLSSDGWDRTPSLVSLALLLLDPYYRTFQGFQALVEVHWGAFGHQFADRLGLPSARSTSASQATSASSSSFAASALLPERGDAASASSAGASDLATSLTLSVPSFPTTSTPFHAGHPSNQSPVFLQWIDAVAQVQRLFPRAFEFSTVRYAACHSMLL